MSATKRNWAMGVLFIVVMVLYVGAMLLAVR